MLIAAACSSNSATSGDASIASSDGAIGSCSAAPAAETGDGTYYDADGTGNC
jgi:hypothetical protein